MKRLCYVIIILLWLLTAMALWQDWLYIWTITPWLALVFHRMHGLAKERKKSLSKIIKVLWHQHWRNIFMMAWFTYWLLAVLTR